MAELAGLVASVTTLAALAAGTCKAIHGLHSILGGLPGRLIALGNEIADLEVVLGSVTACLHERGDEVALRGVPGIVTQAQHHLERLAAIVEQIQAAGSESKLAPVQRAYAWKRHHSLLNELQDNIVTAKSNLQVMLGACTSNDLHRIQIQLTDLSAATRHMMQRASPSQADFQAFVTQHNQQLSEHITRVVTQQINTVVDRVNQRSHRRHLPAPPSYNRRRTSSSSSSSSITMVRNSSTERPSSTDNVQVRVANATAWCQRGCPCSCHKPQRANTPTIINRFLGQLFVGYSGVPVLGGPCDSPSCKKTETAQVQAEYWFPIGVFWSKILQLQATYEAATGPSLQLRMMRRVPDSAAAVNFSMNGNISGLKDLFLRGGASPVDVSDTRGYSLLRWALYSQQWETCRFLLNAGADADYRPKALSDNSPRNKASDLLLQGGLPQQAVDVLTIISRREEWIEDQNLPLLHKIVLGISGKSLVEAITEHPDAINDTDNMGRTALLWAAARGDSATIVTLLMHNADPNVMDVQHSGPVSYAADRNHAICVRLLLEAGAHPDPKIPGGYKIGSPLNCAARNATDPMVLQSLLEFRADVDACGVDGRTPLIHAARNDRDDFALLLLEYNANINAVSTAGHTPLTTAIMNNSHRVLRLLLERWDQYADCPRLKGPNLLKLTAQYANLETISILLETDHFHIRHDKQYSTGDFETLVQQRPDAEEKLTTSFLEFMDAVRREADHQAMMDKCGLVEDPFHGDPSFKKEGTLRSGCPAVLSSSLDKEEFYSEV